MSAVRQYFSRSHLHWSIFKHIFMSTGQVKKEVAKISDICKLLQIYTVSLPGREPTRSAPIHHLWHSRSFWLIGYCMQRSGKPSYPWLLTVLRIFLTCPWMLFIWDLLWVHSKLFNKLDLVAPHYIYVYVFSCMSVSVEVAASSPFSLFFTFTKFSKTVKASAVTSIKVEVKISRQGFINWAHSSRHPCMNDSSIFCVCGGGGGVVKPQYY